MGTKGFFVASTGQHIGKTTMCLGLLSGLKKRVSSVGFIKAVGQETIEIAPGRRVDKDVVLFKEHFQLKDEYEDMSPVLLPRGFTRSYLDGEILTEKLIERLTGSFHKIESENALTIIEGTGHVGVGSIVDLNNAQVAALLKAPIILVGPGGLGSAFDQLALSKAMCEKHGAKIAGVILNRVLPEKREMVTTYMQKALSRWDIPLLGCIPYDALLSYFSMRDLELLFSTALLSGEEFRLRHFQNSRVAATSVEAYQELIESKQLIITPARREDIIKTTLLRHYEVKRGGAADDDLELGMILTGDSEPAQHIIDEIRLAGIPMLYTPVSTYTAMSMINSFIAKIQREDVQKITEAIDLVESHIDFDLLLAATSLQKSQKALPQQDLECTPL